MGLISIGVTVFVVLALVVTYKLWKNKKAVTGAAVVAGVEADLSKAANTVANTVSTKL